MASAYDHCFGSEALASRCDICSLTGLFEREGDSLTRKTGLVSSGSSTSRICLFWLGVSFPRVPFFEGVPTVFTLRSASARRVGVAWAILRQDVSIQKTGSALPMHLKRLGQKRKGSSSAGTKQTNATGSEQRLMMRSIGRKNAV